MAQRQRDTGAFARRDISHRQFLRAWLGLSEAGPTEPGPEPRKLLPSLRRPSARSPMSVPRLPRLQLHMAARKGSKRIVLALLAKGAKVSATDYSRNTPLHQAVIGGHARLARRTWSTTVAQ